MEALEDFIARFGPLAEAIVEMRDNMDQFRDLTNQGEGAKAELAAVEAKLSKSREEEAALRKNAELAKTQAVEANAQRNKILAETQQEASRIVSTAMTEASEAAAAEREGYKDNLSQVKDEIEKAKVSLKTLNDEIAARRREHDQVLSSISILSDRLRGAA